MKISSSACVYVTLKQNGIRLVTPNFTELSYKMALTGFWHVCFRILFLNFNNRYTQLIVAVRVRVEQQRRDGNRLDAFFIIETNIVLTYDTFSNDLLIGLYQCKKLRKKFVLNTFLPFPPVIYTPVHRLLMNSWNTYIHILGPKWFDAKDAQKSRRLTSPPSRSDSFCRETKRYCRYYLA